MRRDYFEAFRQIDKLSSEAGVEARWTGRLYYPPDRPDIVWGEFFKILDASGAANALPDGEKTQEDAKENRIAKAAEYIRLNHSRKLTIEEIAEVAGYSISWFEKLFRDYFHMSPVQYQTKQRIDLAEQMIRAGVLNISEISRAVGFYDAFYFSRVFKKHMGLSPSRYRQTIKDPSPLSPPMV